MSEAPDKWKNFEPYNGEPLVELPSWLQRFIITILVLGLLSTIFAIAGLVAFYFPYAVLPRGVAREFVFADTLPPWRGVALSLAG